MAPIPLSFTKLIVGDLERSAAYYEAVFGLSELYRVRGRIAGERFEQAVLGADGEMAGGLVLVRFTERDAPPTGGLLLGFVSDDLAALFDRALNAGAIFHEATRAPEISGVALVGFLADPDGHVAEIVQPASAA